MPRKTNSSKKYNNFSTLCAQGVSLAYDESIWDDQELIDQFDEALREWKEERQCVLPPTGYDTDPEEVPDIGPWVEVPSQVFNPEIAFDCHPFPALNDLELINLYDEALAEWRDEREPTAWKKYLEELDNDDPAEVYDSENSAKLGPWVVVDAECDRKLGSVTDIVADLEVVSMYDEALKDWKDERDACSSQSKPVVTSSTPPNPELTKTSDSQPQSESVTSA